MSIEQAPERAWQEPPHLRAETGQDTAPPGRSPPAQRCQRRSVGTGRLALPTSHLLLPRVPPLPPVQPHCSPRQSDPSPEDPPAAEDSWTGQVGRRPAMARHAAAWFSAAGVCATSAPSPVMQARLPHRPMGSWSQKTVPSATRRALGEFVSPRNTRGARRCCQPSGYIGDERPHPIHVAHVLLEERGAPGSPALGVPGFRGSREREPLVQSGLDGSS
ncbi:unnamed protein product [Rangifer tarandus platyrhynchus]|uniref:Uncharacterized protein n=2 Tax=Rangifer tarandus platyrhynchus TaxID=3082113 RepID=A0ABN8YZ96_RANTA|nr:unnamed protein product [Rangifer tarandus platyrhynchus]CAI9705306.1 unnamed protein product [Rangifer tarandus platyrhynchus]